MLATAPYILGYVVIGQFGLLLLAEKVRVSAELPGGHQVKTVTKTQWIKIPLQNVNPLRRGDTTGLVVSLARAVSVFRVGVRGGCCAQHSNANWLCAVPLARMQPYIPPLRASGALTAAGGNASCCLTPRPGPARHAGRQRPGEQ